MIGMFWGLRAWSRVGKVTWPSQLCHKGLVATQATFEEDQLEDNLYMQLSFRLLRSTASWSNPFPHNIGENSMETLLVCYNCETESTLCETLGRKMFRGLEVVDMGRLLPLETKNLIIDVFRLQTVEIIGYVMRCTGIHQPWWFKGHGLLAEIGYRLLLRGWRPEKLVTTSLGCEIFHITVWENWG